MGELALEFIKLDAILDAPLFDIHLFLHLNIVIIKGL